MFKLFRNYFGKLKILTDPQGRLINWGFLDQLCKIQESEGIHLANSSKSVADVADLEATSHFCRVINNIFGIFNSRNLITKKLYEKPLSNVTAINYFELLENCEEYFKNLNTSPKSDCESTKELSEVEDITEAATIPFSLNIWHLTLYLEDVVAYIAGFIVKRLKKETKCLECLEILETSDTISKL
nr:unnamed protein product [Callosobruchus analis]